MIQSKFFVTCPSKLEILTLKILGLFKCTSLSVVSKNPYFGAVCPMNKLIFRDTQATHTDQISAKGISIM